MHVLQRSGRKSGICVWVSNRVAKMTHYLERGQGGSGNMPLFYDFFARLPAI